MATDRTRTRRALLQVATTGLVMGLAGCSGGSGRSGSPSARTAAITAGRTATTRDFALESTAFEDGASIPPKYTCEGEDVSPPLSISGLPQDADSVAVIVDDPDAPGGTFTHWLVWNLPASGSIPGGVGTGETGPDLAEARMGENDFGSSGYRGPCSPTGDGAHTYRFTAYAVSGSLSTPAGAERATLETALEGSTVGASRFTGEFGRE